MNVGWRARMSRPRRCSWSTRLDWRTRRNGYANSRTTRSFRWRASSPGEHLALLWELEMDCCGLVAKDLFKGLSPTWAKQWEIITRVQWWGKLPWIWILQSVIFSCSKSFVFLRCGIIYLFILCIFVSNCVSLHLSQNCGDDRILRFSATKHAK